MSQPSNVFGPFERMNAFGATVRDFSISANWGDQSSFLNLILVEDPVNNDYYWFQPGEVNYDNGNVIGQPFQVTYEGFTFGGLLKATERTQSIDGYPTYRATLVSPVEVLDAAQVVLAGYVGTNSDILFGGSPQSEATFSVSNLLNVYGWAENGGASFGRSQATDIGMPWTGQYGVQAGLSYLTSIPNEGIAENNYGSYIQYKGNIYTLDLSNFPVPPSFYRIGGAVNMTLLELLNRFFEDAGVNYMINLQVNQQVATGPHVISFTIVPRYVQQPLGKILQYINGQSNISSATYGEELRSDITQAILVGGSLNLLQIIQNNGTSSNILPFWGFDFQGKPIVGTTPGGTQFADDNLQMNLNATSVADIMGELGYGVSYPCSVLELRCALGNYDTWAAFIQLNKLALAQKLHLYGSWDITTVSSAEQIFDLINDNSDFVNSLNTMFQNNHWSAVAQRLYEFVRGQAEVYYGKKFLVLLPFEIQIYLDPSTGAISLSNELCDAGYAPEGEQLLGLNSVNESYFLDQTGRFYPFVQFLFYSQFNAVGGQRIVTPNVAYLKGSSTVTQYNTNPQFAYVYSRCEQGDEGPVSQNGLIAGGSPIFYVTNTLGLSVPAMVVTIPDAIWAQADDITGNLSDLAFMMNLPVDSLQNIVAQRSTSFNMIIHPPAYYPIGIASALKSNQEVYGPWGKFTADGKLNFEQDEGLVPWDYGGYQTLNEAAIAKLNTIAMGNQVLERADFVEAGLPKASPGQTLISGGPILTSVHCEISISQVTTTYTMETFVNRAGAFILENAERLRRVGKIYQQLRRTIRQQILNNIQQANIMKENYAGFMYGTSYAVEQHTPHGVLGARLYANNSGNYTPTAWTQTYQESLANLGLNNEQNFISTACVGMEALLRPYTTNRLSDVLSIMPGVDTRVNTANIVIGGSGKYSLNPLQDGCDINWLLSGNEYTTLRTAKAQTDYNDARSLALRGPIMISSWGFDLQGNPVPNSGAIRGSEASGFFVDFHIPLTGCNNFFIPDYLKNSNQWPAAPLDLMYDKIRATWASPGMILEGTNSGNNFMNLYVNDQPTSEMIKFTNFLGGSIPTGVRIQIGWNPMKKAWTAISAACST